MACNSLSYTPFDSVLLCLYLCVSFDLLEIHRCCKSVSYVEMVQIRYYYDAASKLGNNLYNSFFNSSMSGRVLRNSSGISVVVL